MWSSLLNNYLYIKVTSSCPVVWKRHTHFRGTFIDYESAWCMLFQKRVVHSEFDIYVFYYMNIWTTFLYPINTWNHYGLICPEQHRWCNGLEFRPPIRIDRGLESRSGHTKDYNINNLNKWTVLELLQNFEFLLITM